MIAQLNQTMTEQAAFDGQPARLVELSNRAGMSVTLMDIGATWLSCQLPLASGERREVLLGVGTMQNFERQASYMGVTVGRYANRIANGLFSIDGVAYQVSVNQAGNCLHGGAQGFDKRRWHIESQSSDEVTFALESPNGDQGFPGHLNVNVQYQLTDENQLTIRYWATTDAVTPVNLTNHAYFNLMGAESGHDCLLHKLMLNAPCYLPTNNVGIPLGTLRRVSGTSFDFNTEKTIGATLLQDEQQQCAKGYDHSYLFERERDVSLPVACVTSPDELIRLSVCSNKPAIQLYTGNWLAGTPNRSGSEYRDYAGFALETQFLPDSPNHPDWPQPSCLLSPGEEYRYFTSYRFDF
ncbi:galactose-1-epimerase [Vibrio vulnificus]|uniref:galactose-1-epimerase n=1 Tax=Vibrio vulnificus TaxID=672 RepID=UPI001E505993|nr:galactose-1-epimerase [Vibrio vulnificus]EHI9278627.1 galactose-1-epimerase [Vibrio vulnificus]EHU5002963.1 galactose-1-epimerase [Vibrio vulnificus]EJE8539076.1 galactose-1-epimerase [Vibrio vulnificus]EKA7342168.1 galactose-1-epimerase [Vibrio vulnificus]EKD9326460.1 galactose-1-epimerase [Vibrio vulnificus]